MIWHSNSMRLPVSDGEGQLHAISGMATIAFMSWPKSAREAFMLTDSWMRDLELFGDGSVSEFVQSRLNKVAERSTGGKLAGQILLHYLSLAEYYSGASVNKAQYLVWVGQMRDVTSGPTGKRILKTYWSDFKPAAHLWAAFCSYPNLATEDLRQFLAIAEAIRVQAEHCGIDFQGDVWLPPNDLAIDASQTKVSIPRLSASCEQELQNYRAPTASK